MYAYGPSHLFKATILYEDIQQCRLTETPLFCTKTDSHAWEAWKWSEVAQSCPTPCGPVDCSPPGSSLHGILQARILEWVAISFSRGSSQPRDRTQVSCIASRCFNLWATREAPSIYCQLCNRRVWVTSHIVLCTCMWLKKRYIWHIEWTGNKY